MLQFTVSADLLTRLQALFTRCYQGTAAYLLASGVFVVDGDQPVLDALERVKETDARHALVLAELIEAQGAVAQAGAFPHWYRDLNYLTVPYIAGFVRDTLRADGDLAAAILAVWPDSEATSRALLVRLGEERAELAAALDGPVKDAREREAAAYREGTARVRAALEAKEAAKKEAEKQAREAARAAKAAAAPAKAAPAQAEPEEKLSPKEKAKRAVLEARKKAAAAKEAPAAPAADLPDPNEPGISQKEKAKRQILKMRAEKTAAAPAAPAAPVAEAGPEILDPNEEGISPKEKAKRQILKMRAEKSKTQSPAAPAAKLLDPNEEGISPKEKAKRQILKMRAEKSKTQGPAEGAGAAPAQAAPAAPAAEDIPDPDEEGISPKEKARRKVLWMRAETAGAAAPAPAVKAPDATPAPAGELLDPDEPGISPKEKAKRQVLKMRAEKSRTQSPVEEAGAAPAPASSEPAPAAELLDPDEPGISPKEKAKRQVLKMRAERKAD